MKNLPSSRLPGLAAMIICIIGLLLSLDLVIHTGRKNHSFLLVVLFACWVLSPFVALLLADLSSRQWTPARRKTLSLLMVSISLGSVICYAWIHIPGTRTAFIYLAVPLISWLIIAITYWATAGNRGKKAS
ncbi:MAG TPA: hypothetical protein VMI35_09265 [Puia sp.]|nr:hypothetical protein [Puia sp.]